MFSSLACTPGTRMLLSTSPYNQSHGHSILLQWSHWWLLPTHPKTEHPWFSKKQPHKILTFLCQLRLSSHKNIPETGPPFRGRFGGSKKTQKHRYYWSHFSEVLFSGVFVFVGVSLGLCLGLFVSLSLALCLFVSVSLCRCLSWSLSLSMCLSVSVSLSLCLFVSLSLCLCLSVALSVSVCLCLSVSVSNPKP